MKILFLILSFLLTETCVDAQVNIEFSSINEYAFNTRQALNLVIVSSNVKSFPVYIEGHVSDASGQAVVEFKSSELVLNPGSNMVTPMNVSLADVNYINRDIAEIENRTGSYPSGNYTVCIWLNCVTPDCSGAGANAVGMEQAKCIPVHIENPTPLILVTPPNEGEIEETRPLFSWIPPSPVAGSANLNYNMVLVELMEGQSKADALNMNRPLIEMSGIERPSLMFPSDLPALEPGKQYAWQVEAFVGKTSIAKSEQWKFKIKKKEKKVEAIRFIDVMTNTQTIKVSSGEKLYFLIRNGVMNHEPQFSVSVRGKQTSHTIQKITKDSLDPNFDEFSQDFTQNGITKFYLSTEGMTPEPGETYELKITLVNQKKYYLRFEIIN